jgi:hypothetical protein
MTVSGLTMTRTSAQRSQTTAQAGPEKPVQPVQNGPWSFALEHCDLLTEGQDLQRGVAPAAKENSDRRKECEDRVEHEPILLTCPNVVFLWKGHDSASC